jgi:hypothetical protein
LGRPDAGPTEIFGAVNNDIINLGLGAASVYLGGAGETVNGGGGEDTFVDTAATIGATLKAGTGKAVLKIQNGGTAVMGSNITGMSAVFGSTGTLTVMATAAQAGVAVYGTGGAAATTLEITTGGSVTLNSGDKNLTLQRAAADTTMLPFNTTIKVLGGGGDDTLNANTGLLHAGEIGAGRRDQHAGAGGDRVLRPAPADDAIEHPDG